MKYKIKPRFLTVTRSRFRLRDFPDYISWQNAVYAAYEANPDDPDPKVQWIRGLITTVENIDHTKLVDITDWSDEQLREHFLGLSSGKKEAE